MKNHYQTLGVSPTANADEIKSAYRRLAGQHHPDKGGDTQKFQEIQSAYDTLGDTQKRAAYDNPQPQFGGFGGGGGFDFNDIFSMFGQGGFNPHARRGPGHVRMSLWVTLHDVAIGGSRTVNLGTAAGTTTVNIDIPLGINDGDNVQYSGIGPGGADLVVQFRVHPHQQWERQGLNLIIEQRVSIWDLIIGGSLAITTLTNTQLTAQIPANCQPSTLIRLRGQGLKDRNGQQGDAFIRVLPMLPTKIAPEIIEAIKNHRE
jgi:DnaJ-class molecular chaperone